VTIGLEPIGHVRSARGDVEDDYWGGTEAAIEFTAAFEPEALQGLEEFSHVEVLFFFDRVDPAKIVRGARHPRNNESWPAVGIFAQRGKNRPNRLGSTVARILRREDRRLHVAELDAIDGMSVLDLKPVLREFLPRGAVRQPDWPGELMQRYWDRRS
jgi:tRNA (Thr-GGU) A37 N-methylase